MLNFNYSLDEVSYSWQNALLWGNFAEHCRRATQGSWNNRVVHALIAATEFLPIVSQIASICEKLIIDHFASSLSPSAQGSLADKKLSLEVDKQEHKNFPNPLMSELPNTIESQQQHKTYK